MLRDLKEGVYNKSIAFQALDRFLAEIGYKPDLDELGEIFSEMETSTKRDNEVDSYEFFMAKSQGYIPITIDAANALVEKRGRIFWNDQEVFDKYDDPNAKGPNYEEYYKQKYAEIDGILKGADKIYLYQQNSYYGYLRMGDKIPEKKKPE